MKEVNTKKVFKIKEERDAFFKRFNSFVENFKELGVSELKSIGLIYQTAFNKIIDRDIFLSLKMKAVEIDEELVNNSKELIDALAGELIEIIKKSRTFSDVFSQYVNSNSSIKKIVNKIDRSFKDRHKIDYYHLFNPFKNYNDEEKKSFLRKLGKRCKYYNEISNYSSKEALINIKDISKFENFKFINYAIMKIKISIDDIDLARIYFLSVVLTTALQEKYIGKVEVYLNNFNIEDENNFVFISNHNQLKRPYRFIKIT